MLIECVKCGAKLHSEDKMQEGLNTVVCSECNTTMDISVSIVEDNAATQENSVKATNLINDILKGMDIDKAIANYMGD